MDLITGDSNILKIDVEGHEYEVLEGGKRFIRSRQDKSGLPGWL